MKDVLINALRENTLCEIYQDESDRSSFHVGFIINIDETNNTVLYERIDSDGKYCGMYFVKINSILSIKINDKYLKKIELLTKYYNQERKLFTTNEKSLLENVLNFCMKSNLIVELYLCDTEYCISTGIITEIAIDSVTIKCIDEYGEEDGADVIDIRAIVSVSFDTSESNVVELVSKIKI